MKNKRKGISLIVLVITIIVIVILATAMIVNIANNNPISKAKEATVKSDFTTMKEELTMYVSTQYANLKGNFDVNSLNADSTTIPSVYDILTSLEGSKYDGYVNIINGKIAVTDDMQNANWAREIVGDTVGYSKAEEGVKVTGSNATITGKLPKYTNPVIPVGFTAKNTTAIWEDNDGDGSPDGWNEGLVILDEYGNEYVWIPVGGDIEYSKRNDNSDNDDKAIVKYQNVVDDSLPDGVSSEIDQITKYGGFYVARYEAGLSDTETTDTLMATKTFTKNDNNRTDIGKAQSKPNKIVWNRINYTNAKIVAEDVISNNYVQSGLLTGTQWDTMCKFVEKAGVDVLSNSYDWGNYWDRIGFSISDVYYRTQHGDYVYTKGSYTKSEEGFLFLPTGVFANSVSNASPKNLFDVAGNVWEYTSERVNIVSDEQTNVAVGNLVTRGGGYYNSSRCCATIRSGSGTINDVGINIGFRFALFIK